MYSDVGHVHRYRGLSMFATLQAEVEADMQLAQRGLAKAIAEMERQATQETQLDFRADTKVQISQAHTTPPPPHNTHIYAGIPQVKNCVYFCDTRVLTTQ